MTPTEEVFYIHNDFLVTFIANEDLADCDIRVGYISPTSQISKYDVPTSMDKEINQVHFLVLKTMNTIPGKWKFWIEDTNKDRLVADSTEIIVTVKKH